MQLDHVFVFVDDLDDASSRLRRSGLTENFRRAHPGQGTGNACFCFDNAYVELLAVLDEDETRSAAVRRTRLYERSLWPDNGACPFGIAYRPCAESERLPVQTWDYRPPYLPPELAIPVAELSDDPKQPFVFMSPARSAPASWPDGRAGGRQADKGFISIGRIELVFANGQEPDSGLAMLANLEVSRGTESTPSLHLEMRHRNGSSTWLELPAAILPGRDH